MNIATETIANVEQLLARGLSLRNVAGRVGISRTTVSKIQRGEHKLSPREQHAERMRTLYTPIKGLRRKCERCRGYVTTRGCLACDVREQKNHEWQLQRA